MDLTIVIQVAIGIMFVWIVLAMITSQIQEWISSVLSWRADMLEDAIGNMLGNDELRAQFYEHALIKGLHTNHGKRKPGGIPDDKFALVVFELLMNAGQKRDELKSSFENLKESINALKGQKAFEQIACSLDTLLLGIEKKTDQTVDAITEARKRTESWFNNAMERLIGAYKRRVQIVAVVAGILIAVALNADTIAIANKLWTDPVVRQVVASQATKALDNADAGSTQSDGPVTQEAVAENVQQLEALTIPLGWSPANIPGDATGWMVKICGLLVSGAAAAQGAPFWFDLMRKILSRPKPSE